MMIITNRRARTDEHLNHSEQGSMSLEAAILLPAALLVMFLFIQLLYSISTEINLRAAAAAAARELSLALTTAGLWEDMPQTSVRYLEEVSGIELPSVMENWVLELTASQIGGQLMLERTWRFYEEESRWPGIARRLIRNPDLDLVLDREMGVIWLDLEYELDLLGFSPGRSIRTPAVLWHDLPLSDESNNSLLDDIWSLPNIDRGFTFNRYYRANLPRNYPVFDIFRSGQATAVVSIDLTAPSYTGNPLTVESLIRGHLNAVSRYRDGSRIWQDTEYYFTSSDIVSRNLQLAVPENSPPDLVLVIEGMRREAMEMNINLKLEKAGFSRMYQPPMP